MSSLRTLRVLQVREKFERQRQELASGDLSKLKDVLGSLRKDAVLPGDSDVFSVIPPALPAWARRVPGTGRWVLYRLSECGTTVHLWALKYDSDLPG